MSSKPQEAGSAHEVLARLGISAEDLLAGRVPDEQRTEYHLGDKADSRASRRRSNRAQAESISRASAAADGSSSEVSKETGDASDLTETAQEELARTIALRKLTAASQSRAMLAQAITAKGVSETVAKRVLDRFAEVGLIDDSEYAAMLVRTRHSERHQARFAIAQELRRRGIDEATAQEALDQIDDTDEKRAALAFAQKKMRSMRGLEPHVQRRRLMGALSRRGFRAGIVHYVINDVAAADEAAPNDW